MVKNICYLICAMNYRTYKRETDIRLIMLGNELFRMYCNGLLAGRTYDALFYAIHAIRCYIARDECNPWQGKKIADDIFRRACRKCGVTCYAF